MPWQRLLSGKYADENGGSIKLSVIGNDGSSHVLTVYHAGKINRRIASSFVKVFKDGRDQEIPKGLGKNKLSN